MLKRPNNTIIVPVKGKNYVYAVTEKIYKKERRYNVNKRVCVGKMVDDVFMVPNKSFSSVFPDLVDVFYDDVRGAEARKNIMRRFALYDRELEKLVETKLTRRFNVKKFEKYYRMKFFDDYLISFRRKEKEIEKELDYCGYFVLVSSEKMTAEEALTKYRHRDASEKQFLNEKSFLGGNRWRVHSDEALESKQLIAFVALIVRNELFKSLEPLREKEKKKYTVPAAIRELERMIITRNENDKYLLRYALTAIQKNIFRALGMSEERVRKEALEASKWSDNR